MSSHFNYQINYGAATAAPPAPARVDPAAPLYASEDGVVASLSNNECIFQVKRSGETHVMTFQVLQALDQVREFRSLDEHVSRILATWALPKAIKQKRDYYPPKMGPERHEMFARLNLAG